MSPRRAAFTLLEICLTLMIGVILILLAVPSIVGLLADQRLHESYTRFEKISGQARFESLRAQIPMAIVFDSRAILLCSTRRDAHGERPVLDRWNLAEDEAFGLDRPAALLPKPVAEWIFWPNGTCEPVIVSYKGPGGQWQVSFDPLTMRGTFLHSETL